MVRETKPLLPTTVVQSSVALQDLLSHPQTLPPLHTAWATNNHPEPRSHVGYLSGHPVSITGAYVDEQQG